MAESKYCYACYCKKKKDVPMIFYPGISFYGTYKCTECPHEVNKKQSKDTGEKYI